MNTWKLGAAAGAVLLALAASLAARSQPPLEEPVRALAPASVAKKDLKFFETAAHTGMAQVEAGRIAVSRAASSEVRDFANMLVNDHSASHAALKILAAKKNVTLPSALNGRRQNMIQKLQNADAQDFDQTYIKMMLKGHVAAVKLFTRASKQVQDADVRSFAADALPALKNHLNMAKGLKKNGGK